MSGDGTLAEIIEPNSSTRSDVVDGPDAAVLSADDQAGSLVVHPLFRRHSKTRRVALSSVAARTARAPRVWDWLRVSVPCRSVWDVCNYGRS